MKKFITVDGQEIEDRRSNGRNGSVKTTISVIGSVILIGGIIFSIGKVWAQNEVVGKEVERLRYETQIRHDKVTALGEQMSGVQEDISELKNGQHEMFKVLLQINTKVSQ